MADFTTKLFKEVNGILIPGSFSSKCFEEALAYKPKVGDNFIVTYPKSGTTWAQSIVINILRKGQPLEDFKQFGLLSPFIDSSGLDGIQRMPRPGAFKTHLPYNRMPYSADAKYIFVARNPRDTCVSLYYHLLRYPGEGFTGSFDDYFELFINGQVEYNDYFDHLLSWYPDRHDKNLCYTTYEQMKAEPKSVVCKFAKFLGNEYIDAIEKDNVLMNNILHYTSFQYMKENWVDHHHHKNCMKAVNSEKPKIDHIRKGIVGDWKNHLSEQHLKRLDEKFIEKFKGTDILTWWSY